MLEFFRMPALPTFAFRAAARERLGSRQRLGDTLTADERQTVLDAASTADRNFNWANSWALNNDLEQQFGVNAPAFESLMESARALNSRVFDIEGALLSDNPADWNVSADDIAKIQQASALNNQLDSMITGKTTPGQPPSSGTPSSGSPDLFFLPPTQPGPAPAETPSFGLPDLLKLVAAGGAVAAPYLKNFLPGTTTPKPVVPATTPSTGMPWWGWTLLGVGGVGAGIFLLRRFF